MNQLKIFVINLKRSCERREAIINLMDKHGLEFEFFDAIDGSILPKELVEKARERSNHWYKMEEGPDSSMKLGEIGVAMSHYSLYEKILRENHELALIMEDDINFDERLGSLIMEGKLEKMVSKQFDLVLLGYCTHDVDFRKPAVCSYWGRQKVSNKLYVGIPVKWYWSAIGYVINKNAAKLLSEKQGEFPCVTADILTANSPRYGVRLGVVSKQLVWPGPLNEFSTIQIHNPQSRPIVDGNPDTNFKTESPVNFRNKLRNVKKFVNEQKLKILKKQYMFTSDKY